MTYNKSKTALVDKHNLEVMYLHNATTIAIKTKTSDSLIYITFENEEETKEAFDKLSQ